MAQSLAGSTSPMPVKARIGLLMATRNQADLLHHALGSLLAQSHGSFTLTLVNDGSEDQTPQVLTRFQDPRIQVITTRPQGLISSLNLAMQKTKPVAFYAVVYASCFYNYNFLEDLLMALLRAPRAAGIYCNYHEGHARQIFTHFKEPSYDANEMLVRNFLGPGVMFRGEAFKQAGGLFVSEKKGIWETWQRMSRQADFISHPSNLLRWTSHPYDAPAPSLVGDPEQDIYPHLKLKARLLPGDAIDPDWLNLMSESGHRLIPSEQGVDRPHLVLCGSINKLPAALKQAYNHYAPLLLVLNEPDELKYLLSHSKLRYILANCTIATRTLKIAQLLTQYKHQPLVYMPGMTQRETNRLLSRVPMLLWRHRSVILVRAYGSPAGLQKTLQSLYGINRPPDYGELLIFCIDRHPELIRWLKSKPYTWFAATQDAYFADLLFMLRQIRASFVLSLDAGVIPAADFLTRLWPLLSDPAAGMASGHLNFGPAGQAMPVPSATMGELSKHWPRYRPARPSAKTDILSDSAFLIRKQAFEWALASYPETLPLSDETQLSRLLGKAGFYHQISHQTLAYNLAHSL